MEGDVERYFLRGCKRKDYFGVCEGEGFDVNNLEELQKVLGISLILKVS